MEQTENPVTSLQVKLNERAAKKLKADLHALFEDLCKHKLLMASNEIEGEYPMLYWLDKGIKSFATVNETDSQRLRAYPENSLRKDNVLNFLRVSAPDYHNKNYNISGTLSKALFDYWLPIYIERETKNFINKVDELDNEVKALKDFQED